MSEQHVIMGLKANLEQAKIQYQKKIDQYKAELDKHRWIPVSERLPDALVGPPNDASSKKVWIIFRNEYHIGYYTDFAGWRVCGARFQKRINQKDITHWMEPIILPEQAPKEKL